MGRPSQQASGKAGKRLRTPTPIKPLSDTTIRKRGNVYYMFYKTRRRVPWRIIIALIVVFIGAIGSAFSFAQIHSVRQEIESSQQTLLNQRVTNSNLEAQITQNYTREEIEFMASELGMGPPDPSQIVYFHVPHHSGVILSTYAPQQINETETGFWQSIVDFFSGIFSR